MQDEPVPMLKRRSATGSLVQLLGLLAFFGLPCLHPLGLLAGPVLGVILLVKGHGLATAWTCGACGETLPARTVTICRACRSPLVAPGDSGPSAPPRTRQREAPPSRLVRATLGVLAGGFALCAIVATAIGPLPAPVPKPAAAVAPAPLGPRERFVTGTVEVRLAPSPTAVVTNTLHRQDRVEVLEVRDDWARVSKYYDGAVEGVPGTVARWVPESALSAERPPDLEQPHVSGDPRVDGIPRVGEGGLSERDVQVLHAAAGYFLETGEAARVEYGDKSVSRPGTYFLNFGGPRNRSFTPGDIPDLERRIQALGR